VTMPSGPIRLETPRPPASEPLWQVYLLRCKDGSLYCGIAMDIQDRLRKHNQGTGAKYTRGRGPCELVAQAGRFDMRTALLVERTIKCLKPGDKIHTLQNWGKFGV